MQRRYLILSLTNGIGFELLKASRQSKGPTKAIQLSIDHNGELNPLSENDILELQQSNRYSHIDILGHCFKGEDYLGDNLGLKTHRSVLAKFIATSINPVAISGAHISVLACYAAEDSSPHLDDNFAGKFHIDLASHDITNIDLTAYTDAKALRLSSATQKIYKYSNVDIPIIQSATQRKHDALLLAKQAFKTTIISTLPLIIYDPKLLDFYEEALTPEVMLDKKLVLTQIELGVSCFVMPKLMMLYSNTTPILLTFITLQYLTLHNLINDALKNADMQVIEQVKANDRNRIFSKVLYTWQNGKQHQIDSHQAKKMEKEMADKLEKKNFVMAQAYRHQRTHSDKLSFFNRVKEYNFSAHMSTLDTSPDKAVLPDLMHNH